MWVQVINSITNDPGFEGGDYARYDPDDAWPGMHTAAGIQALMGAAPLLWQDQHSTRAAAEQFLDESTDRLLSALEPTDTVYAYGSITRPATSARSQRRYSL